MADKSKIVIIVLAVLVIVLAAVILYAFVIQPAINTYNIQQQTTGYQYTVSSIMRLVEFPNCQIVPLTDGNRTVNIVAVDCLQQPVQ